MVVRTVVKDFIKGTSHSVKFLLKNDVERTISKSGIKIRKLFAGLLRMLYLTQTEYRLIIDKREKLGRTKKGRIFAINHRQADDIVLGANAVGESAYIVFGNPYLALETTNGIGLWAYGMILLKRDDISSRKAAYAKMKWIIEHGGNIIIYPEGYWNLADDGLADERHLADGHNSENWLVQDINIGILRLAKETGCEIVPTILHYDEFRERRCYAYRGKTFRVGRHDDIFAKKDELVHIMTNMYWGLMEKYSQYSRADLEKEGKSVKQTWEELKELLRSACDIERIGYRLDLADEKRIGKARSLHYIHSE
ncbi:MAG: 1-acyl-sn-glycerol-3-phosphate acyltransferase [Lachnospiraceae bacterium]|nr:1-acyl-sn-glycerol-3-phosphate acyltransferase [Lachnospiraceae bacterium]